MERLVSSMQRTNVPTLFDFRRQRVTVPALPRAQLRLTEPRKSPTESTAPPQQATLHSAPFLCE